MEAGFGSIAVAGYDFWEKKNIIQHLFSYKSNNNRLLQTGQGKYV